MLTWTLIGIGTLALLGLLRAERFEVFWQRFGFKLVASLGFVLLAVVGGVTGGYDGFVLAGLLCCLAGDVLLVRRERAWFAAGLVAFLCGHVCYAIAFFSLGSSLPWVLGAFAVAGGLGAGFVGWLWPKLGPMRFPVLAYTLVITVMVSSAFGALGSSWDSSRWLAAVGALAFFVSDLSVALDAFRGRSFVNRLWGLPLYYLGQYLIAWTVGLN